MQQFSIQLDMHHHENIMVYGKCFAHSRCFLIEIMSQNVVPVVDININTALGLIINK